jgi:hypothetical protein
MRQKVYCYVEIAGEREPRVYVPGTMLPASLGGRPVSEHPCFYGWVYGKRLTHAMAVSEWRQSRQHAAAVAKFMGWM